MLVFVGVNVTVNLQIEKLNQAQDFRKELSWKTTTQPQPGKITILSLELNIIPN